MYLICYMPSNLKMYLDFQENLKCVCVCMCAICVGLSFCFYGDGKSSWFRIHLRKCWSVSSCHYFRDKANSHFLKHALSYTPHNEIFWGGKDWQLSNFFQKHFYLQACHLSLIPYKCKASALKRDLGKCADLFCCHCVRMLNS